MSYKTILLHLDSGTQSEARVEHGIDLARRFDAHLVGLSITAPLVVPSGARTAAVVRIVTEQWEQEKAIAAQIAAAFAKRAQADGVASIESRVIEGELERVLCLHARYADLVIIGQARSGPDAILPRNAVEHVVLGVGRPVLILPYVGAPAPIGRRILVAWNASREATRALTDALPLLQQASQVDVLTVNAHPQAAGHGEFPGADIALYLTRHGVRANVHPTYAEDVAVGEWLLSRAADHAADLIVMGAYGHSRLREMVLGGATRTMLESMTVPVLMAH
jgi:nucleotide-binding universal stress UspA family protein